MRKEKARQHRQLTLYTAQSLPEDVAVSLPSLYPEWAAGTKYAADSIIRYGVNSVGQPQLYRVVQTVTAQENQKPGGNGMLAVYRPIGVLENNAGAAASPIPFVYGMDCESGKYYSFEGVNYLCKQDMKPCVWYPGTPGLWQWERV